MPREYTQDDYDPGTLNLGMEDEDLDIVIPGSEDDETFAKDSDEAGVKSGELEDHRGSAELDHPMGSVKLKHFEGAVRALLENLVQGDDVAELGENFKVVGDLLLERSNGDGGNFRMEGDAHIEGRLGIGAFPEHPLHVENGGAGVYLKLGADSGNRNTIVSRGVGDIGHYRDLRMIGNDVHIRTATTDEGHSSTERITVKHTTGRVGIGITDPATTLHVDNELRVRGADADFRISGHEIRMDMREDSGRGQYPFISWYNDGTRGMYIGWGVAEDYIRIQLNNGTNLMIGGGRIDLNNRTRPWGSPTSGSQSISSGSNWTPPRGWYQISRSNIANNVNSQISTTGPVSGPFSGATHTRVYAHSKGTAQFRRF